MRTLFILFYAFGLSLGLAEETTFELSYQKQLEAPKAPSPTRFIAADGLLTIDLHGGIASATLRKKGEAAWPKSVHLRLHTSGMERFEIASSAERISGSVQSHGTFRHFSARNGTPLDKKDPKWMRIKLQPKAAKIAIPHKGFFEIEVPQHLLTQPELKLSWIDFYR